MDVNPRHAKVLQRAEPGEERLGPFDIHAELGFLLTGAGELVRVRIDVGIDAKRPDGLLAHLAGDAVDVLSLFFGFDVERGDAGLQGVADFLIRLADAGVDDLAGLAAGLQGAIEFAAAGDIKPAPSFGQDAAEVDVAAALDREADGRIYRGEGVGDLPVVMQDGLLRVDIGRRAKVAGDLFGQYILTGQFTVTVDECIHSTARNKSAAATGSISPAGKGGTINDRGNGSDGATQAADQRGCCRAVDSMVFAGWAMRCRHGEVGI